jgi:predicted ATP-grasp superfamily ATP-dependent carboligase
MPRGASDSSSGELGAQKARPRVLLTNGEYHATVSTCRSLAAAGYRVSVVAGARPAATHWSRACEERFHLSDATKDPAAFVEGLARRVREKSYAALLPGSDGALLAISSARERLERFVKLGLPPHAVVQASLNKLRLIEAAGATRIAAPKTYVCERGHDAIAATRQLGFPVLLKSAQAILDHGESWTRPKTRVVSDRATLERLVPSFGRPCLIQACERGVVHSCAGIVAGGELLALVTSRYRRTWPPDAGAVAYSETIAAPAGLREDVETILRTLGWQGLFELELMRREDGSFAAIDFNPRLYGSVALAIAAGADLPAMWCAWLLHGSRARADARAGVAYRWIEGDLRHLVWRLRTGQVGAAVEVLVPRRGVVHPEFRLTDPGPLFARALELGGHARRKRGRQIQRDGSLG